MVRWCRTLSSAVDGIGSRVCLIGAGASWCVPYRSSNGVSVGDPLLGLPWSRSRFDVEAWGGQVRVGPAGSIEKQSFRLAGWLLVGWLATGWWVRWVRERQQSFAPRWQVPAGRNAPGRRKWFLFCA